MQISIIDPLNIAAKLFNSGGTHVDSSGLSSIVCSTVLPNLPPSTQQIAAQPEGNCTIGFTVALTH